MQISSAKACSVQFVPTLCCTGLIVCYISATKHKSAQRSQYVWRVRCWRKPVRWGRLYAQVRCLSTKLDTRSRRTQCISCFLVCCSPANAADAGSSPAQTVRVQCGCLALILLLIWADIRLAVQRSKGGTVQTLRALTVKQIYEVTSMMPDKA